MCLFDKSCAQHILFPDLHTPLQENTHSLIFLRITQMKFTVSDHKLPWTTMVKRGHMTMDYHGLPCFVKWHHSYWPLSWTVIRHGKPWSTMAMDDGRAWSIQSQTMVLDHGQWPWSKIMMPLITPWSEMHSIKLVAVRRMSVFYRFKKEYTKSVFIHTGRCWNLICQSMNLHYWCNLKSGIHMDIPAPV